MNTLPPPVVRDLYENTGDHLRALGQYSDDNERVLFIRDDDNQPSRAEFLTFLDNLKNDANSLHRHNVYSAGELHASVELYDNEVVIHIHAKDPYGIAMSLDPAAGSNLLTFIESCTDTLSEHTPYRVTDPNWSAIPGWDDQP